MLLAVVFLAAVFVVLQTTAAKADGEDEAVYDIGEGNIVITVDSDGKTLVSFKDEPAVEVTKPIVIIGIYQDFEPDWDYEGDGYDGDYDDEGGYNDGDYDDDEDEGEDEGDDEDDDEDDGYAGRGISISVPKGANVHVSLRNVSIATSENAPITVLGDGTVTIELDGSSYLDACHSEHAGIEKIGDGTLVITDTDQNGVLWVNGGEYGGAGIGSKGSYDDWYEFDQLTEGFSPSGEVRRGYDVSNIIIAGGEIHACGGMYAAGIGSGVGGNAENITISGGFVASKTSGYGAGIGSGVNGEASGIAIKNDVIVIAQGFETGENCSGGAGIGYGGTWLSEYSGASAFNIVDGKPVPDEEIIDVSGLYDVGRIAINQPGNDWWGEYEGPDYLNSMNGFVDYSNDNSFVYVVSGDIKTYNLWVGGTLVSEKNCSDIPVADGYTKKSGKASYDPDTHTLTLDNYQYEGPGHRAWKMWGYTQVQQYYNPGDTFAAIYYGGKKSSFEKERDWDYLPREEDTLTIVLKGENSVKQDGDWARSCGVLIGDEDPMMYEIVDGVEAYDEDAQDGPVDYGVHLVLSGYGNTKGSLIAEADDTAAPQQYVNEWAVGSSAGDPWLGGFTRGIAVMLGHLTIDGVDVEAIGGDTNTSEGYYPNPNYKGRESYRYTEGVYCAFGLNVIDGTLIAQAGDAPESMCFSFGIETGDDCNFEGGVVKAFGGNVRKPEEDEFGASCGIALSYMNYLYHQYLPYQNGDGGDAADDAYNPVINIGTGITTVLFAGNDMATDMQIINYIETSNLAGEFYLNNEIAGEGWFTFDGSDDSTVIEINENEEGAFCGTVNSDGLPEEAYLRAKFHQHKITYTASGDTITANCADEGCDLSGQKLTIIAPKDDTLAYDGTAKAATLNDYDETAFSNVGSIVYTKDGEAVGADKVVDAGKYKATVTVTDGDETYTAEVEFEITKKDVTEDDLKTFNTEVPTGLTGVYGQKLEEITLPKATEGDNGGTWAWSKSDTVLGPVGEQTYEATFTPNNTNYNAGTFKITVKVLPKEAKVTADDASKSYNAKDPELKATVEGLIGEDTIEYTLSRAAGEDAGTYVITAAGEQTQGNYTVTFVNGTFTIEKAKAPEKLGDDEQPKANDLSENDKDQPLVTKPNKLPNGYTKIQYSDDGGKTWKDTIPTGKEPGEYNIQVRYIGDGNHEDFTGTPIKVTIKAVYTVVWLNPDGSEFAKKTYGVGETEPKPDTVPSKADDETYKYIFLEWEKVSEEGHTKTYKPVYAAIPKNLYIIEGTFEWKKGSDNDIVITVKRTVDDQTCFSHFKAVKIGDTVIVLGEDYDAKAGSTVITLKASTLEKLELGDHPITVVFDDGEAKVMLSILKADPTSTPTPAPVNPDPKEPDPVKTGDTGSLLIWTILAVMSAGAAGGVYAKKRLRGRA